MKLAGEKAQREVHAEMRQEFITKQLLRSKKLHEEQREALYAGTD